MSQQQTTKMSSPTAFSVDDVSQIGQKQASAWMAMQHEFAAWVDEASKTWTARTELEKELASELWAGLSNAKTISDAARPYQDWFSRHLEVWTEDGRKAVADGQKFVEAMTRCMTGQPQKH